jgi:hypothetical protein
MFAATAIAIFLIPVTFYVIEKLFAARKQQRFKLARRGLSQSPQ